MSKFENEAKKILLIRHTDLDGFAAGAVIANSPELSAIIKDTTDIKSEITDLPYNYNGGDYFESCVNAHITAGSWIFIVDISISNSNKSDFAEIIRYAAKDPEMSHKVIWFDHHTSSIEWAANDEDGKMFVRNISSCLDNSRSGAYIAYRESFNCTDDEVLDVIKYVDDHDRFIHAMSESVALNDATFLKAYSFLKDPLSDEWTELITKENPDILNEIILAGKSYHQFLEEEYANYYAKNGYKILFEMDIIDDPKNFDEFSDRYDKPLKVRESRFAVFAVLNRIGNSLMFGEDYNMVDACVTVINRPTPRYSMYSPNDYINCAKFANLLGGGGHIGAAGTPNMPLFSDIEMEEFQNCGKDCNKQYFDLSTNLVSIHPVQIPENYGGGEIKYAIRRFVTKSAAEKLISSKDTIGNAITQSIDYTLYNQLIQDIVAATPFTLDIRGYYALHYANGGFTWLALQNK